MFGQGASAAVPAYGFKIVHVYPHDRTAFTEGLFYLGGFLYESTGLAGRSAIRKESLATGKVLQTRLLAPQYFGEGIVNWRDHLIQLTWRNQVGFVYDLAHLKLQHQFSFVGEGWALAQDGRHIIMSDGTPQIRFLSILTA